jgi:hypothetical protein
MTSQTTVIEKNTLEDRVLALVLSLCQLSGCGLVQAFAVTECVSASGATVTCHTRTKEQAAALADLLKVNGNENVLHQETHHDGGDQHTVAILIEE